MTAQFYKFISLEWAAIVLVWNAILSLFSALRLVCCCAKQIFQIVLMLAYAVQLSMYGIGIIMRATVVYIMYITLK